MAQQPGLQESVRSLASLASAVGPATLELGIVIPTYNERGNVAELVSRLERVLIGVRYEVLFVDDDSRDGTFEAIRELAATKPWVRGIRRIGRQGLASACLEGMLATMAPAIAVMDADLQHDEAVLRRMLDTLRDESLDVVVGTRNHGGGSMGEFAPWRVRLSHLGLRISRMVTRVEISDPMSGFFMVTRGFLSEVVHRTSGVGFKILLDLLASARRPVRVGEVAYTFRNRQHGDSKLDLNVGLEYLYLVLDKLLGDHIPVRFVLYMLVGTAGVVLHLGTLSALLNQHTAFAQAQLAATGIAMTANFLLNNLVTHRDSRLRGWQLLPGLASFYLACSIGCIINLSISEQMLARGFSWFGAGLAGLTLSSVWNYGVTSVFTWRRLKRKASGLAKG